MPNALQRACGWSGPHAADWEEVAELVRAKDAAALCAEADVATGELVLHLAARAMSVPRRTDRPTLALARQLVRAFPEGCSRRDKKGRLPLHVALAPPAKLNSDEKQQAREKHHGQLHHAVSSVTGAYESDIPVMVQALVDEHPAACREADAHGKLPLDIAIESLAECETVQCLIGALGRAVLAEGSSPRYHDGSSKVLTGLDVELKTASHDGRYDGRTARDILAGSNHEQYRLLVKTIGAFLGRYQRIMPPVHKSETATVYYATDTLHEDKRVCLKLMTDRVQMKAEVEGRQDRHGRSLEDAIVSILGWHTPPGQEYAAGERGSHGQQQERTDSKEYPYVLVLETGERSLFEACVAERIAGYQTQECLDIFRSVLQCVQVLHKARVVHADLKPRNIIRVVSKSRHTARWLLCDMDASTDVGHPIGKKSSSGYEPPELARVKYSHSGTELARADTSFDIWSLGVILYELSAGRTMFNQDTSNDQLVEEADEVRLCTWETISPERLAPVFDEEGIPEQLVSDAKHMLRWCLKGNPDERPTVTQLLEHRLLSPDAPEPHPLEMTYTCFMSHAQADGAGAVGTLFFAFAKFGLTNWLDMRQQDITLEGMKKGVRDSRIFLLFLTKRVLASWYCQQEMLEAIRLDKKVQIVLEEEPRFHPFGMEAWRAQEGRDERQVAQKGGQMVGVPAGICEMIDKELPNAITYRRRDFEQEAMMRELCRRIGVVLPARPSMSWPSGKPAVRVAVICNPSGAAILGTLAEALDETRVELIQDDQPRFHPFGLDEEVLATADRVLVMLTKGVLQSPTLEQLEGVLRHDAAANHDRIVTVFSEPAGWTFGCDEQLQASAEIQQCLSNHEAICYRAPDEGGRCCHEFPAMIQRLESSFTGTLHHSEANNAAATDGHNGDGAVSVGQPSVEVESSLRQKLKEQEELLAERDQRIRELEAAADEKRSATLQRKKSKKKKHRAGQGHASDSGLERKQSSRQHHSGRRLRKEEHTSTASVVPKASADPPPELPSALAPAPEPQEQQAPQESSRACVVC